MLAAQIKEIRKSQKEYQTHLWEFSFAGNTLELTVKPNFVNASEMYRLGVIAVGQVIRALDDKAIANGYTTQIHSFPSLNETQLIASIRLHRIYGEAAAQPDTNSMPAQIAGSDKNLLKALASHYGLFFKASGCVSDTETHLNPGSDNKKKKLFSICTAMDNPFIWLKVGQWLEGLKLLETQNNSFKKPFINCNIKSHKRTSLSSKFGNCSYCQVLVALENSESFKEIQHLLDD